MNTLLAVFVIAALGCLIGSIKVGGVKLGTAGVLLVALVFGHFGIKIDAVVRNLGLVCFVASVGFIAGPKFFRDFRKNAGNYTAKATKLSNPNYALPAVHTRVCTIKKKTVKLKWTKTKLKYTGKSQKPTATATGLIKGDKCTVTVSGAKKKKGTYTARATKLSNKNYQLPKKVTVKFKIY